MDFGITFLGVWVCSFLIARVLSLFFKTYWKNDLVITAAQSLIITILLVFFL